MGYIVDRVGGAAVLAIFGAPHNLVYALLSYRAIETLYIFLHLLLLLFVFFSIYILHSSYVSLVMRKHACLYLFAQPHSTSFSCKT